MNRKAEYLMLQILLASYLPNIVNAFHEAGLRRTFTFCLLRLDISPVGDVLTHLLALMFEYHDIRIRIIGMLIFREAIYFIYGQ